jgi:hypothetical protein
VDKGEEVDCSSVVSCGDVAEVFEFVEASFDTVSRFVDLEVVGDRALSGRVARDDSRRPDIGDEAAEVIAVVGLVGEDMIWLEAIEQSRRLRQSLGRDDGIRRRQTPGPSNPCTPR